VPTTVALDEVGVSLLDQVVLGLATADVLAAADVYTDLEGTTIATRAGDVITTVVARPWDRPADVRTDRPVAIAAAGRVPRDPSSLSDLVVLLPAGGVRIDDARFAAWSAAWTRTSAGVIRVPVVPGEVDESIAAHYSQGEPRTVDTVPQPPGTGRVVFFTGLSGSGKSTLARLLTAELASEHSVTLLDGDVVRTHLSRGLGFSREDRDANVRRIGWVAAEVAKHGGIAVCAPIAPYDETRRWVRQQVETTAGPRTFVLVWVSTPLATCEERDVKGLYARARAGEITGFTGIDDPYETPSDADVTVDTSVTSVQESVDLVLSALSRIGDFPVGRRARSQVDPAG
jgi:sulfate adenylyltransferase